MTRLVDTVRTIRRAVQTASGRNLWLKKQTVCEVISLGNEGARWCVSPEALNGSSIVYSFGVGEDVSFDLELILRFGVRVHAFDPTPRSIAWVQQQSLPREFVFHQYGVANFDGRCRFLPPKNPAHVSHTFLKRESPWPAVEVEVRRVRTIMDTLGHDHIDLLKMDIEGAEYGVLADLVDCAVPVKQLLVEFHHRWREVGMEKTKQVLRQLNEVGYRIFSVSPNGEEYSFLGPNA